MDDKTDFNAAMAAGAALAGDNTLPDGTPYTALPPGYSLNSLEKFAACPAYVRQTVKAENFKSFSEYFNRFKTDDSLIFASRLGHSVCGVIDYHKPRAEAAHGGHIVRYDAPLSLEWQRWTGIDGKLLEQEAFAMFIEENMLDVREPSSADVLELSRDLNIKRKVDFKSVQRLQSGVADFTYVEQDETHSTGKIAMPTLIVLGVPVYFGGDSWRVTAFLRYRLHDGRLQLGIQIYRREYIEQEAFEALVGMIESLTERPATYASF